jgi:hypothetical protein
MYYKSLIAFIGCLFLTGLKAQWVSLNHQEIRQLQKLISTDSSAEKRYREMENKANAALTQMPRPVDTIISEGHLATDQKKINTVKSLADMQKIYSLAIVYQITKKKEYRNKCVEFLLAWARTNRGVGNPINDTKLDAVWESYDLLKKEISRNNRAIIEQWMKQVADTEIVVFLAKKSNKSTYNNWNSHRIKVVGLIAYTLNNAAYQTYTDSSIRIQIRENLYPDGSGMDFKDRDALHYHIYTLEPLLKIATVIKRATGKDYFTYQSPSGSSIQKSVAFLVPFATGEKIHHEFVNSKVSFDRKRADNKEPGYTIGADFQPATAEDALSYAAWFNDADTPIIQKLLHTGERYPNWQLLLNAARR